MWAPDLLPLAVPADFTTDRAGGVFNDGEPAPARNLEASPSTTVVGILDTTPQTLAAVEKAWPGGRRFGALPMLAGDASPGELEAVAAISGTAQTVIGEAYAALQPILTGIDALLMAEVACRSGIAAPYTLGWDSTVETPGAHRLTARAVGKKTVEATITVTVPPAPESGGSGAP